MEPKVTLEVTPSGWKWTVNLHGKVFTHEMKRSDDRTRPGFVGDGKGDILDKLQSDYDELAEAIDERSPSSISNALLWLE